MGRVGNEARRDVLVRLADVDAVDLGANLAWVVDEMQPAASAERVLHRAHEEWAQVGVDHVAAALAGLEGPDVQSKAKLRQGRRGRRRGEW